MTNISSSQWLQYFFYPKAQWVKQLFWKTLCNEVYLFPHRKNILAYRGCLVWDNVPSHWSCATLHVVFHDLLDQEENWLTAWTWPSSLGLYTFPWENTSIPSPYLQNLILLNEHMMVFCQQILDLTYMRLRASWAWPYKSKYKLSL